MPDSVSTPTIIVVLGATGDLMTRKIVPSLLHLHESGRIPGKLRVVGFARRPFSDDAFRKQIAESIAANDRHRHDEARVQRFLELFSYHRGDFGDAGAFRSLASTLEAIDREFGVCSNKLFYLAVPPEQFAPIFRGLASARLNEPCGGPKGWTRVLVEKPFGRDLASSQALEKLLSSYFSQEQIYRIDHYLAKELMQGIPHFRFSNNFLESSWSNKDIERIDVRLLEAADVESRGAFYDGVGALRDVGQNHVLAMLSAVTMEYPMSMQAQELRAKRAAMLETLVPWTAASIRERTFRAQYDGYRSIPGVAKDSSTETYVKLVTELRHPTWKGVPITLEAGKRCAESCKEIVVTFRRPPVCLMCTLDHRVQNKVVFSLEPEERIAIHFWTKKAGYDAELEERTFDFSVHKNTSGSEYAEEYGKLLLACIQGDQSPFASAEEVRAGWRFVDPVLKAWTKDAVPLSTYAPGSDAMRSAAAGLGAPRRKPLPKTLAVIGLGKMGANMCRRMTEQGWHVVGYNRSPEITRQLATEGIDPAFTLEEALAKLPERKVVWLMVPAGEAVDAVLFGPGGLTGLLKTGDIVIDGGNSYFKDTIARGAKLRRKGIRFLDCGTSGGPGGARTGACLMIGGERRDFEELEQLFRDFALPNGYQFFPGTGAGHFVKMVHNGIEYGMMQSLAEGFALMKRMPFKLDLERVADIYNHGSVIESRLVGWLREAFQIYGQDLDAIAGSVQHLGEGAWTVRTAKEMKLPLKVIEDSLLFREESATRPSYTGQIVSALRNRFGGHAVEKKRPKRGKVAKKS